MAAVRLVLVPLRVPLLLLEAAVVCRRTQTTVGMRQVPLLPVVLLPVVMVAVLVESSTLSMQAVMAMVALVLVKLCTLCQWIMLSQLNFTVALLQCT